MRVVRAFAWAAPPWGGAALRSRRCPAGMDRCAVPAPLDVERRYVVLGRLIGLLVACTPTLALAVPTLYGTDEDTGHLVKVEDYDSNPIVTDYGLLSINDNGTLHPFPDTDTASSAVFSDIESFTLDDHGIAYMIGNGLVALDGGGTYEGPQLYSLQIFNADGTEAILVDDASASGRFNALEPLGVVTGIDGGSPINGLDFDPITGLLIGVVENGGRDDLISIDPETVVATVLATSMDGTDDVEDIQFDSDGTLYLIDDDGGPSGSDDVLHRAVLDRSGAMPSLQSIEQVNNSGGNHRIESLGWDFQNDRLVAFSDTSNSLFELNPASDGFVDLGGVGFNDIEGTDFVPTPTGLPVPEPGAGMLFVLGLAALQVRGRAASQRAREVWPSRGGPLRRGAAPR